ncbi:MATE family efflux transporter [Flavimaricola marinus]|uniref:Multidrug-efflux transporter n=1 Tax=Flavimaricola marinus TaxID=1819565 RepID=A0A238LKH4_9RHOB|nr:MATE family efflux transporter [Flavimaricola marinus]SMY09456.1 Multidrug resistance protein NorM [Flavimaricola marinus]
MTANPLTYREHAKLLLALGLPLVGTSVAGFAIHMTDTLMLGWYSVTALAAATIASSFWFITFIVGAGFGRAVVPLVAEAVAQDDETTARRVTRMALWLSVAFGCVAVAVLWESEALFLAIGQTPTVAAEAQNYMRIAVFGMFPALIGNVIRSYLAAQGLTAVQLWITVGALLLNVLANYVLIFGNFGAPEMGIKGAAVASILVQSVQAIVLCWYAHWKLPEVRLFQRIWKADPGALLTVFRLGGPIGLTGLAEGGLFAASAVMMGWIGEVELAAHGIALQLAGLTFMFHVGMAEAATVRAGRAFGHRDRAELAMAGQTAYAVGLGFSVLVVTLFVTMPGLLISLFVDPSEPQRAELIAVGTSLLLVAALFQLVDAGQILALSLLRGVQDTAVPMWMAIGSYWAVGLPAGYLMGFVFGWGGIGIWFGLTVGLGAAALSLGWRFWGGSIERAAIPRPPAP